MIEMGIDPVNTAKRLGHASSQMTLDTYSHSNLTSLKTRSQQITKVLFSTKKHLAKTSQSALKRWYNWILTF